MKITIEMTIAELYAALKQYSAATSDNFAKYAEVLNELWKRGETHPLMKQGPLKWHKEIAAKRLHPDLAFALGGGHAGLLRKMFDLPLDKQRDLAHGQSIVVAIHDEEGKIVPADQTVAEIDTWMHDIVFSEGRIRTFAQQKKILAARGPTKPPGGRRSGNLAVRADVNTGELVWGRMRIHPNALSEALGELGYEPLRRKKPVGRAARHEDDRPHA